MSPKRRSTSLASNWLLAFMDPGRLLGLFHLPGYLADWLRFSRLVGPGVVKWRDSYPCLTDRITYTPFDAHYFYQAAWAARKLADGSAWHVDVGSSVTLMSVISAMLPTIFVDYRPLKATLPGLTNIAGNILALPFADNSVPSLSCLHVIEHIGLGRYGDSLDPKGSEKAVRELTRILAPGGRLLLSMPVGRERVQFNAHRIFCIETVLEMIGELKLIDFALVDDDREFYPNVELEKARNCEYACGMFEFRKPLQAGG